MGLGSMFIQSINITNKLSFAALASFESDRLRQVHFRFGIPAREGGKLNKDFSSRRPPLPPFGLPSRLGMSDESSQW